MCPLCKNLIFKHHLQFHYKECKEKDEDRKIREELKKQTSPQYRYEYLHGRLGQVPGASGSMQKKSMEFQKQIQEIRIQEAKVLEKPIVKKQVLKEENSSKTELKQESKRELKQELKVKEEIPSKQEPITVENYSPPTQVVSLNQESMMHHFFLLYQKLFYDYVNGKTVALVGPAESILGTKRGEIIDRFDLVVRLNKSIPLPKDLSKDIGTRTDILYNSLNISDFPGENKLSPTLHKKYGIKFVCSSYPFQGVFKEDVMRYVRKYRFELPFKVMDDDKFRKFEMSLGTRPYTGTCAIMDLLSYPIKYLYVTGLDFYYSKYYSQYREISKGQLKHTRNSTIHNAKPQLNYLRHIALLDERVILDPFLTKIVFEDYDRVWRNMKQIQMKNIFGFQQEQMKQYFEMKLCKVFFTKQVSYPISSFESDKPIFMITQQLGFPIQENQYVLFITQYHQDLKKFHQEGKTNVIGNFYFTNQKQKEQPSVYLHSKFLYEMRQILLRLNMTNPSLYFILFLAILLYFPEDALFLENDITLYSTNLEERKFINFLMRKKYIHFIKF